MRAAIIDKAATSRTQVEQLLHDAVALGLSSRQIGRLRHAWSLQGGNKRDRRRAREIGEEVQREVRAGINETIDLAKARGGQVVDPKSGPVRIRNHDGLQSLFEDGHLSDGELAIGMAYRAGCEVAHEGVGSQLGRSEGGPSGIADALIKQRLGQAKRSLLKSKIDRAVALEAKDQPTCLQVLRFVAGEGHTVHALAGGGKAWASTLTALKRALAIAATVRLT